VQTGAIRDLASHPLKLYKNLGLRVTVNTDNRLVTDTTVSRELWLCHTQLGLTLEDIKQIILSGFKSAFLPFHVKQQYLREVSEELAQFTEADETLLGGTPVSTRVAATSPARQS
jgi:adenosine deaminase